MKSVYDTAQSRWAVVTPLGMGQLDDVIHSWPRMSVLARLGWGSLGRAGGCVPSAQ